MPCLLPAVPPAQQLQPWLVPVLGIVAFALVLLCITIIIISVVVGLKRNSGKQQCIVRKLAKSAVVIPE